ncbi:MAG: hypothetical protein MRJ92_16600 [Nitrospira sp.]|nr:hypothetical protein [Nitrospira sp.]
MRRHDLDINRAALCLRDKGAFSYYVSLRTYQSGPGLVAPPPLEWLRGKWEAEWKAKSPHLPELDELLGGDSYLLLDALNEMPLSRGADYQSLVEAWGHFIGEIAARFPRCRMVFTCRLLDYSSSLSSPELQVPHVVVERLDPATIRQFLRHYAPENADRLFEAIQSSNQLELYGTAYFLKMLCDHAGSSGEIPQDRPALFTAFVRELLRREIIGGRNKLLGRPGLLLAEDLARLNVLFEQAHPGWRSAYELPERGPLFPSLSNLAHSMQSEAAAKGNSQVVVSYEAALGILRDAAADAEKIVQGAADLAIIEHDRIRESVQFVHQLMQEYFASRRLVNTAEPEKVLVPWRSAEVMPSIEQLSSTLNINEPLPPLDGTGWEETTLLASAMHPRPMEFIQPLLSANLPLAGRAVALLRRSPEGRERVSSEFIARIRQELSGRSRDPAADLRARIAAGKALGELGDPRFEPKSGKVT